MQYFIRFSLNVIFLLLYLQSSRAITKQQASKEHQGGTEAERELPGADSFCFWHALFLIGLGLYEKQEDATCVCLCSVFLLCLTIKFAG